MSLFHEKENFLTEEELQVVDNYILTADFPWYYQQHATSDLFPFHSHVIFARDMLGGDEDYEPVSNSALSSWVTPIVKRYSEQYLDKPATSIFRACINSTHGWNLPYPFIEPHVDHKFDHMNLLIYLNDDVKEGGETLLFDKYLCEGMEKYNYTVNDYDQVQIMHSIKPQKGKALCFDGRLFHGVNNFKSDTRRIVLVATFA